MYRNQDIEKIKAIIGVMNQKYEVKGGEVRLSGIEDGIVSIAPTGFCWR